MRLFNVLISPEGESELKNSFNKSEFEFIKDEVKINNKYISNNIINQRLRIDKFIDTDSIEPIKRINNEEHTVYSFKTYDVVNDVNTDIVLNDKTLNPLLLKSTNPNTYEIMYITIDARYKMISYEIPVAYDKIISTYHKKDFYGCAVYFDRTRHSNTNDILHLTAIDTTNNSTVSMVVSMDDDLDSSISISYYKVDVKTDKKKTNRFKLKLNPHKIPTAFIVIDDYNDNDRGEETASDRLDKICVSKQTEYVELGNHKIDDPEFIKYLQDVINENHYRSATFVDLYVPTVVIKKLGLINVFNYDSSKKICKCIRSS